MSKPPASKPRSRGIAREAMLRVSSELFLERGYASTSIRDIAAALSIQSASLYHYIDSKEELLYDICMVSLNELLDDVSTAVSETEPGLKLQALVRAHTLSAIANRHMHATRLIEMRFLTEEHHKVVAQSRDQYEALVRDIIGTAQEQGFVRTDIQAKYLTLTLLNLLNWTIFWFRDQRPLRPEEVAGHLYTVFHDGVAAPVNEDTRADKRPKLTAQTAAQK